MLSDELLTHAAHFERWTRQGGINMDAHLCGLYVTIFRSMSDQAAMMERRPIPDGQMPLPPGVVSLDQVRADRHAAGIPTGGAA